MLSTLRLICVGHGLPDNDHSEIPAFTALESAPLLTRSPTVPFGRVRLADGHDAPLSHRFDHLVWPPRRPRSVRALSFVTLKSLSDEDDEESEDKAS